MESFAAFNKQTSGKRSLMVCSVQVMSNGQFWNRINVRALDSKNFLRSVRAADAPPACKIACIQNEKGSHRVQGKSGISKAVKMTMFKEGGDAVHRELGTKLVRHILCVSISDVALRTYGMKEERIIHMLLRLFQVVHYADEYLNDGRSLKHVAEASDKRLSSSDDIDDTGTWECCASFTWCRLLIHFSKTRKIEPCVP